MPAPASIIGKEAVRAKPVEDSLKYISDGQLANVTPTDWVEVARVMGNPSIRSIVMEQLRKADAFPARLWVDMLGHNELTVRLGALEVLEDFTGHDLDFDPWELNPEERKEAWMRWSAWAEGGGKTVPGAGSTLSTEAMQGYLRDIMSGEPAQAERAMAKLKPFSHQAIGFIETFLSTQTSLLEGMRGRLKEAQYRLLLDLAGVRDARRAGRNLAIGTRDERVEGLDMISSAPKTVLPIVVELLRDPDALVRERAMDVLLSIGKAEVIPLAEQHLKQEKDANVIHAAIRALGKIESSSSVRTLIPYLNSDDEDMVATTLQSLSLLGSPAHSAKVQIEACLRHEAWRVRAAALQCITKIRLTGLDKQVAALVDDEDSFVRAAAVMALASVAGDSRGYDPFGSRSSRRSGSESGGGANTTGILIKAFEKHDDLKAVIFKAFSQMKREVPQELLDSLKGLPPDILVSALATLEGGNTAERTLLMEFAGNPDLDVACTALRILAKFYTDSKEAQPLLVMAMMGKDPAKRDAVLDSLRWSTPESSMREWEAALKNLQADQPPPAAPAPQTSHAADSLEKQLLQAFMPGNEAAAPVASSPPAPSDASPAKPRGLIDALVDAFTPKRPSSDAAPSLTHGPSTAKDDLIENALNHLAGSADLTGTGEPSRVARQAALMLVVAGSDWAVRHYEPVLAKLDVQDRAELADALARNPSASYIPMWQALLDDPSREVRQRAMRSALQEERRISVIKFGLMQLMKPKAQLSPADAYGYSIESLARDDNTKKLMLDSARQMIAQDRNPPLQVLGLIILRQSQSAGDKEAAAKLAKSPYYWVRRAAVLTLGRIDPKALEPMLPAVADDSSAWVREAAAASYGKMLKAWTHHFDDNTEVKDELYESHYEYSRGSSRFGASSGSSSLKPETIALLRKLTQDSEDRVQLCAWLALLVHRQEVDVQTLCSLLDRSPDREVWSHKLADYVENNYLSLGPALRPLLERVEWKYVQANKIPAIERHFGIGGGTGGGELGTDFAAYAKSAGPSVAVVPAPQFVTPAPGAETEPLDELPLTAEVNAIFFYNPGCPDCETVRRDLAALKRRFTGLKVHEHNIRDTQAVLLNEALSRRFSVPPDKRQVSPAVFFQEGVLIKADLNRFALEHLIEDTLRVGDSAMWFQTQKEEIAAAKEVVQQRFEGLQLMGVFMAGLLDGINPCAFATIIFFLSYMQVTRRSPRGILAVGVAFIAGVFISYFVLGLGLVEVVARIEAFRAAATLLNWALAIACLVIAYLSFRDARLARAGRLQDMTLQLPGFLKTGIRGVIRTGAKSTHFVIAAFLSGLIIAALELACTGQVYLPTIVYAMKTGIASATGFLLLYNVAFIVPLGVIFVLAWRGMKSEALIRFQKNHTATVKFALGGLFLLLFFMIVWSGRL